MFSRLSHLSTKIQSRQNPFRFGSSSERKNVQPQLSPHSITTINRCRTKLNVFLLLWWKHTAFPLHCTHACHSLLYHKTMLQVIGSEQSIVPRAVGLAEGKLRSCLSFPYTEASSICISSPSLRYK